MEPPLCPTDEVADALAGGRPVVALESTIVSHGMPHPENVDTARALEDIGRAGGAVPATVALIDGSIRIGLADDDLERLGTGADIAKVSLRDVGAVSPIPVAVGIGVSRPSQVRALAREADGGIGGSARGDALGPDGTDIGRMRDLVAELATATRRADAAAWV